MSEEEIINFLENQDNSIKWDYSTLYAIRGLLDLYYKEKGKNKKLKFEEIDFWISDKEIEERLREKFIHKEKIKEIKDRKLEDKFITVSQGKLDIIIELEKLLGE